VILNKAYVFLPLSCHPRNFASPEEEVWNLELSIATPDLIPDTGRALIAPAEGFLIL
jgi:hypothetical protein